MLLHKSLIDFEKEFFAVRLGNYYDRSPSRGERGHLERYDALKKNPGW